MDSGFKELGDALREAREAQRLSCEDVALQLSIRKIYIQAMERGDFAALPRGLYTEAHLRSYAQLLKMDDRAMAEKFRVLNKDNQKAQVFLLPDHFSNERRPVKVLVYATLGLAIATYGFWFFVQEGGSVQAPVQQAGPVVDEALSHVGKDGSLVILATGSTQVTFYDKSGAVVSAVNLRAGDTYFLPEGIAQWAFATDEKAFDIFVEGNEVADFSKLRNEKGWVNLNFRRLRAAAIPAQDKAL